MEVITNPNKKSSLEISACIGNLGARKDDLFDLEFEVICIINLRRVEHV